LALVFASVAIGAVLLFLTGLMRNLPEPVLAAVVLIAVGGLIRPRELLHLKKVSKLEFRVAMLATVGVLSFGILKGVLLAAIFSIFMLLKGASHPRIALLGRVSGTDRFVDSARYPESEMPPNTLVLRVESGLFYFNAQSVKSEILRRIVQQREPVRLVVIDLSTCPNIDLPGVRMLGELEQQLIQTGVSLRLAEVHGAIRDLSQAEGLNSRVQGINQRLSIAALVEDWAERYKSA
jgi:MFS superfamily sulfate permease-like transporter